MSNTWPTIVKSIFVDMIVHDIPQPADHDDEVKNNNNKMEKTTDEKNQSPSHGPAEFATSETWPKILVLISSTIATDNTKPFSYSHIRSVFSPEERLEQTIQSILSVQKYIPKADIAVCDNSTQLSDAFVTKLKSSLGNLQFYHVASDDAISLRKSVGETNTVLLGLNTIPNIAQYDYVFKLSGRYALNDKFKLTNFTHDKMTFWSDQKLKYVRTVLYCVPKQLVSQWKTIIQQVHDAAFINGHGDGLEYQMYPLCIPHAVLYNFDIGVEGRVAVDGGAWSG